MAQATFVKKARKDNPVCKKGESYWWWEFRFGGKHYSLTKPRPSQLTQSEFLSQMYGIEERIEDAEFTTVEDFQSFVEEITGELENLRDETQDKFDNMPEQLQDAETGQLLESRIEACEDMISEFEDIDTEIDMDEIEEELKDLDLEDSDKEEDGVTLREQQKAEIISQKLTEKVSEIQNICYNGE